jgi:hypothetical protein
LKEVNSDQTRSTRPYSILSLLFGIPGFVLPLTFFIIDENCIRLAWWYSYIQFDPFFVGPLILLITGVIIGVKGLKTARNHLAIVGITASVLGLIFWACWMLIYLTFNSD